MFILAIVSWYGACDVVRLESKMFLKVVFITLCSFLTVACINLTYIVKKDENVIYPSCIAEERERYAAIGWIYPIPNEVQKIPNISEYLISCIMFYRFMYTNNMPRQSYLWIYPYFGQTRTFHFSLEYYLT